MTMVEPSIAQATQDIENSNLLPGYRLKVHLVDSKCSVSDATFATQATCSTGPQKHILLSDSCSAACAAVNDAARFFQILQVGPGCVSARLRDSERYPFFTRMAPSTFYNVVAIYELMKFLSFKRVGVVYGYRDINHAAKDLFLDLLDQDLTAGRYPWTVLTTLSVKTLDDAKFVAEETHHHDARINFMALYELEGAMVLCQAYKDGMQPPDYNWFVASGWWNEQFLQLTANSAVCPCTVAELQRASFGLIAADRGPMLRTEEVHSLSGRRLRDLYDEYTQLCEAFGNGRGSCNHQWAGYFYDGLWLIAKILDTFLVQQNKSLSDLGTLESRQALYNLSLAVDFYGQTGRVRQWRSDTQLDREGIVLLRQVTGTPEKAFGELAYRSSEGFEFQTDILWASDGSKKVLCQGSLCQLQSGWIPVDGVDQCSPGEVWSKELGCSKCDPGTFSSDGHGDCDPCPVGSYGRDPGMAQCVPCAPGTANPLTGMTACIPCLVGHFMNISGALLCEQCPMGEYAAKNGQSNCTQCPPGRTTTFEGATEEELCRCDGNLWQGRCVQCESGTRFELGSCVSCQGLEICQGGRVVGYHSSDAEWFATIELAGAQSALSQEMARRFFLVASDLQPELNRVVLRSSMSSFAHALQQLLLGDAAMQILAAPNEEVQRALELLQNDWNALEASLTDHIDSVGQGDSIVIATVAEQNLQVLSRSEEVRQLLSEASRRAGASTKGLVVDIATRQKTLILRFSKEVLLISLGYAVSSTRSVLRTVADLFEASQEAMIFGVDSVGLPKLDQVCTMRQMRDVTFYSMQVLPIVLEVVNAESDLHSRAMASTNAAPLAALTEEFFAAMLRAEQLLENSTAGCEESSTSQGEWKALLHASAGVRCRCEMGFLFFMQIINGVEVDASKVKLTVQISSEHSELRKLVQGSRLDGIPTPPTQDILDQMLEALAAWDHLEPLLHFASEMHGSLPSGHLERTVRLREDFEHRMDSVLRLIEFEQAANSSTGEMDGMPLVAMDLLHLQKMRLSRLSAEAHLVLHGLKPDLHREMLNTTAEEILQTNELLILGDSNALQPIQSLCVIQDMADTMVIFRQVEEAAREVTNGDREEAARLMHLVPEGSERMSRLTQKVDDFYRGLVDDTNCSRSLTTEQWLQLMVEVVRLACLGEDLASSPGNATAARAALETSLVRLQMGSAWPPVPAQATPELYREVMTVLTPLAQNPNEATQLSSAALAQLERYTLEGLKVDPAWPGKRLQVFLWQKVLLMQVYRQQIMGDPKKSIQAFEAAHQQLKFGGGGLAPLVQSESLEAWQSLDALWLSFQALPMVTVASRVKARRDELLAALDALVPVFAVPDVSDNRVRVPWGYYVVYPVLGLLVLVCCVGACCLGRQHAAKRGTASKDARVEEGRA